MQLLANTQLAAEGPRKQAEIELKHAQTNPIFPLSLANIAAHTSISTDIRQSALSVLRNFIEHNWSPEGDDGEGPRIPIPDSTKDQLRPKLLDLALSNEDERKVKAAVRYVTAPLGTCPCHYIHSFQALYNRGVDIRAKSSTIIAMLSVRSLMSTSRSNGRPCYQPYSRLSPLAQTPSCMAP